MKFIPVNKTKAYKIQLKLLQDFKHFERQIRLKCVFHRQNKWHGFTWYCTAANVAETVNKNLKNKCCAFSKLQREDNTTSSVEYCRQKTIKVGSMTTQMSLMVKCSRWKAPLAALSKLWRIIQGIYTQNWAVSSSVQSHFSHIWSS